jgi:hypothetical protein
MWKRGGMIRAEPGKMVVRLHRSACGSIRRNGESGGGCCSDSGHLPGAGASFEDWSCIVGSSMVSQRSCAWSQMACDVRRRWMRTARLGGWVVR